MLVVPSVFANRLKGIDEGGTGMEILARERLVGARWRVGREGKEVGAPRLFGEEKDVIECEKRTMHVLKVNIGITRNSRKE